MKYCEQNNESVLINPSSESNTNEGSIPRTGKSENNGEFLDVREIQDSLPPFPEIQVCPTPL